jgi:hypothetical protein
MRAAMVVTSNAMVAAIRTACDSFGACAIAGKLYMSGQSVASVERHMEYCGPSAWVPKLPCSSGHGVI